MSIQEGTYKVLRSRRRTISIEVNRDLEVIVRAPRWVAKRDIRYFVDELDQKNHRTPGERTGIAEGSTG